MADDERYDVAQAAGPAASELRLSRAPEIVLPTYNGNVPVLNDESKKTLLQTIKKDRYAWVLKQFPGFEGEIDAETFVDRFAHKFKEMRAQGLLTKGIASAAGRFLYHLTDPPLPLHSSMVIPYLVRTRDGNGKLIPNNHWGSHSTIFQGIHNGNIVAIKQIRLRIVSEDRATRLEKAYHREFLSLWLLDHPHIIPLVGVCNAVEGLPKDETCIVFPWYQNGTITDMVKTNVGRERLETWVVQLVDGINYLHELVDPVIHGDIRGGNILIDDRYNVRIADFGLSRPETTTDSMSTTGDPTQAWTAPEVFHARFDSDDDAVALESRRDNPSKVAVDRDPPYTFQPSNSREDYRSGFGKSVASDIWALGCTLYEIYEGKHPYDYCCSETPDFLVEPTVLEAIAFYNLPPAEERPQSTQAGTSHFTMPEKLWELLKGDEGCWDPIPTPRRPVKAMLKEVKLIFPNVQTV